LCAEFHELIEKMEPEERDLFDFLYYDELKVPEVADLLGVSEATVRRRWNKAAWELHRRLNT
jgi:RNA polymerase sigma factor (sigma-70 family)